MPTKQVNKWIKAVSAARKSMERKYPAEFKGKFVPMRKEACTMKNLTKDKRRLRELGHMFYLESQLIYKKDCKKVCKK